MLIIGLSDTNEKFIVLPSLYIFCQPKDLEILSLYEQWEDSVYEDNSSPLPAP